MCNFFKIVFQLFLQHCHAFLVFILAYDVAVDCTTRWGPLAVKGSLEHYDGIYSLTAAHSTSCLYGSYPLYVLPVCLELKSNIKMSFYSLISKYKHTHILATVSATILVLPPLWSFLMLSTIFPMICSKRAHHRIKQALPWWAARKISVALIYGHLGLSQHEAQLVVEQPYSSCDGWFF